MKRFTLGDLKRLGNRIEAHSSGESPLNLCEQNELIDLTLSHAELVERLKRVSVKREIIGRQLNQTNEKLRITKKALLTTQKRNSPVVPLVEEKEETTAEMFLENGNGHRCTRKAVQAVFGEAPKDMAEQAF